MESKEIRELAAIMKESGLTVLDYKASCGESIRMERAAGGAPVTSAPTVMVAEHSGETREEPAAAGIITVKSPMVGIFYSAPGADKEPYVSVGDAIHSGDVICIIEAMKIMNEITAECDGIICEICANNKQVVEYGQPLFLIDTTYGR